MNIRISGNLKGPTVIFIAGWPDTSDVFRTNLMSALEADHRIIGLTLPGFDARDPFLEMYKQRTAAQQAQAASTSSSGTSADRRDAPPQASKLSTAEHTQCEDEGGSAANTAISNAEATAKFSFRSSGLRARRWVETHAAPLLLPLRMVNGADNNPKADDSPGKARYATRSCPPVSLPPTVPPESQLRDRQEIPLPTGAMGHSFRDLVTLLEIAVDAAMETYNYCPRVFFAEDTRGTTSSFYPSSYGAATATTVTTTTAGRSSRLSNTSSGMDVPMHQVPPYYAKPVLIAHGMGCLLGYELLLTRPGFFSRIVALDVGAAIFNPQAIAIERMRLSSQDELPLPPSAAETKGGYHDLQQLSKPSMPPNQIPQQTSRNVAFSVVVSSTLCTSPSTQQHHHETKSLASRYAMRPAKPRSPTTTNTWGLLHKTFVVLCELCIIVCFVLLPGFIARPLLRVILRAFGRPVYNYDARLTLTPQTEAFNEKLYYQYYYKRHYYSSESGPDRGCGCCAAHEGGRWVERPRSDPLAAVGGVQLFPHELSEPLDKESGLVELSTLESKCNDTDTSDWHILLIAFVKSDAAVRGVGRGNVVLKGYTPRDIKPSLLDGSNPYVPFAESTRCTVQTVGDADHVAARAMRTARQDGSPEWRCQRRQVFYKAYFFPPDSKRQQQQRSHCHTPMHLHLKGERVEADPCMGWIHCRMLLSMLVSVLFSLFRSIRLPWNHKEEPSTAAAGMEADQQQQRLDGESLRSGLQHQQGTRISRHIPLLTQRYFHDLPVPVLFMYGGNKTVMLHSDQWCDYIRQEKRASDGISDVVEVPGAGHWFFADPKFERKVAERVAQFIATDPA